MAKPEVSIEVDPASGVWTVDGVPMVLVPRHYLVNTFRAVEAAVGAETNARLQFEAGHKSAYVWCRQQADWHGLAGGEVFRHYMRRLSQRGWARFTVLDLDPAAGLARIRVDHSPFAREAGGGDEGTLCYMFHGWFVGALDYVCESLGFDHALGVSEVACAAGGKTDHCLFEVAPRRPRAAMADREQ